MADGPNLAHHVFSTHKAQLFHYVKVDKNNKEQLSICEREHLNYLPSDVLQKKLAGLWLRGLTQPCLHGTECTPAYALCLSVQICAL